MEYAEEGLGENGQDRLITTDPVTEEEKGQRADVFLAARLDLTRSNVQHDLAEGRVTRQGKAVKANYKVKTGDVFQVLIPPAVTLEAVPQNIPLDILYEDEDVIVINKPRGMVVHPAAGNPDGTLVNALLYHCHDLSGINGVVRPGIVHRLDKDTSGVMIAAKNDLAHLSLSQQIQSKEAKRTYLAIVRGNIKEDQGHIETQLDRDPKDRKKMAVVAQGGRFAATDYQVLERYGKFTVVRCKLLTGRTHQIRVHMTYIGHPLVGDPKYGPQKTCFSIEGQALHSETLTFRHPRTQEWMTFEAPVPQDMATILTRLRNGQFH
ncbi:RluA family pseudouridine synthase [Acidaminococcus sp. NSJ-142]|jgi:23S rRNA pseudouridine1911/1915/1917 synthase|uniref:RluA family pseudouridine synthase n=1 Tax=Acidaminococcus TaxID=904 RepID=UPI000CF9BCF8|nr:MULTISPECIES: RluA family pseudouridine synthase [Acidaminococcus]MCD2436217.1 RluA family pseudouridine synthase [Acidaminococcus hominis]RHJ98176.1 RluA family pseudouridine synthase [Acidaminococcus sp. AM05-11]